MEKGGVYRIVLTIHVCATLPPCVQTMYQLMKPGLQAICTQGFSSRKQVRKPAKEAGEGEGKEEDGEEGEEEAVASR